MKILVVSDVLWRNDNGVGNSYSNLFANLQNIEIANVCCQTGVSKNSISKKCFQISEALIIKKILKQTSSIGIVEAANTTPSLTESKGSNVVIKTLKKARLQSLFLIRELMWMLTDFDDTDLNLFIKEFNPDVIFGQVQDKIYLNRLILYIKNTINKPLFLYAWDDVYSLKQFYLSPLYWINKIIQRHSLRKTTKVCSLLYTITKEQQNEYARLLGVKTKLLYKGYVFDKQPYFDTVAKPIKMLYAGNLYSGRFKTLAKLCDVIGNLNSYTPQISLKIFSSTYLNQNEIKKLNNNGCRFYGRISEDEVKLEQESANVLLHIEPFDLKGSLICRLSFSTKLVDYFHLGKCIFAVGHSRCSSIKYLKEYDAGLVCDDTNHIRQYVNKLLIGDNLLYEYATKCWNVGKTNHDIFQIQKSMIADFKEFCK